MARSSRNRERAVVGPLIFVFLFLPLACGAPREDPEEVTIGVIAPFDRSLATAEGALLAAEVINGSGGVVVGSRRVRLSVLVEDSESRSETAISKALFLVNRKGAVALLGLPMSTNAIPVAHVAEESRIPMISTLSTHPETTRGRRYVFRLNFLNSFQARAMARFTREDLGIRRAAVLMNAASTYSSDLGEVFRRQFQGSGGEIAAFETFTDDATDVAEQLLRIRESGAEAIFQPYVSRLVRAHMRQARAVGVEAIFLGGDTWNTIAQADDPPLGESYFIDAWAPDRPNDRAAAFVGLYRRKYSETPTTSAALAYDGISILAEAIRRQGATDSESIRTGLAAIGTFEGVSGTIEFEGTGDPRRSAVVRKIEADGSVRFYREIEP